jgi:hypothetical protein
VTRTWYLAGVSLGLAAPAAVPIEVLAADRRVFRLSQEIGPGGVRLCKPAPFEPGSPVWVRFSLPQPNEPETAPGSELLEAECVVEATADPSEPGGEGGGRVLHFRNPSPGTRAAIASYVATRLGLPPLR